MIKLRENITEKEIEFAKNSCLGVRSLGPVLAYGSSFDFLQFWTQEIDGDITAFIIKFYGAVTVSTSNKADIDEIEEFLSVIGFDSLTCDYKEGNAFVMKLEKGEFCKVTPVTNCNLIENSNYPILYDIIMKCHGVYLPGNYDEWYVDLSHRIRHNTANTFLLEVDGTPVSTLVVLSITENCIFITGVSTLEEYRGKHYAHTLIHAVCEKYKDKTVYLFCKEEKVPFYEKAGFENVEKIFTI